MFLNLASGMKSLYSTSEQYLHKAEEKFPILGFSSKAIPKWQFFKSGDRYDFFVTTWHIFFWVCKEKKELKPQQQIWDILQRVSSLGVYFKRKILTWYGK